MPDSQPKPAPIQPPLKLLRSEDEALLAIARMIGKAAARRWLAEKAAAAATPAGGKTEAQATGGTT